VGNNYTQSDQMGSCISLYNISDFNLEETKILSLLDLENRQLYADLL